MHIIKKYFEIVRNRLNNENFSFDEFMLSKSCGINIRPVRFHGFIDAVGWNGSFSGNASVRKYYTIEGDHVHDFRPLQVDGIHGGVVVLPAQIYSHVAIVRNNHAGTIKRFFKKRYREIIDKLELNNCLKDVKLEKILYSYGNFFTRSYVDETTGNQFDSSCLTVEIVGVQGPELLVLAIGLANEFGQDSILIRDNSGIFVCEKI